MENLWANEIPYWNEEFIEEGQSEPRKPTITAYPAKSRCAVIIFPGGGYAMRAEHEGKGYAEWFNSIGITAFVVDYRVAPYKHPAEISDAMRAVKYVRAFADKYGIDRDKIAVMGSSAGGHLAASVSVHYDKDFYQATDNIDRESCRPDATILCYPVIDMFEYRHDGSRANLVGSRPYQHEKEFMTLYRQITPNTPPSFIWHTSEDNVVPCQNSLLYAISLAEAHVPYEAHIYPYGHHGLGLAEDMPHVAQWAHSLHEWLKLIKFI